MNDIRNYELLDNITYILNGMSSEQTEGACKILRAIYSELNILYYQNSEQNNIRALAKTFEKLFEHAHERKKFLLRPRM
jgi:hypothetical protein